MLMTYKPMSKVLFIVPLAAMIAVTGCSRKKNNLPDNAGQLGLNNNNNSNNSQLGQNAGSASPGSKRDFTINVGDRIFFTTDSTSLTGEARQTLTKQAAWLNRYKNHGITIEGHADERGTREYNLALGARRAAATRDYLVSQGVSRGRIRTISFGKERPVAVCNDISCWSQNRRAVTLLRGGSS